MLAQCRHDAQHHAARADGSSAFMPYETLAMLQCPPRVVGQAAWSAGGSGLACSRRGISYSRHGSCRGRGADAARWSETEAECEAGQLEGRCIPALDRKPSRAPSTAAEAVRGADVGRQAAIVGLRARSDSSAGTAQGFKTSDLGCSDTDIDPADARRRRNR